MSQLIDDVRHFFYKKRGFSTVHISEQEVTENWEELKKEIGVAAHAELRGGLDAAAIVDLIAYAEHYDNAMKELVNERSSRRTYRDRLLILQRSVFDILEWLEANGIHNAHTEDLLATWRKSKGEG